MGKKDTTKYDGKFSLNQLWGKWLVIDDKIIVEREAKVLCRCTQCNLTERYVPALQLIKGITKKCSVCGFSNKMENNLVWKGYKEIPYGWFSKYFERSNKKRTGNITIEDIYEIWIKQDKKCALSGVEIDFVKREKGISASIDRIDSKKEYLIDNVQLVHKDINLMKNSFNVEYFINMCKLVSKMN